MTGMILAAVWALLPIAQSDVSRAVMPVLYFLGAIVVLIVVVQLVRKRMRQTESLPPAGFTLGDLRQLLKEGKMSPEEFERAKNKVLDATKRATAIKPAQETVSQKDQEPRVS